MRSLQKLMRAVRGPGGARKAPREEMLGIDFPRELAPRDIRVHVPAEKLRRDTPLLIALDGQMMDAWKLPQALAGLADENARALPLVVTLPASAERVDEYGMAGALDYAGRGRKAALFQEFVLQTVLPAVRDRYGVAPTPGHTGIFGASLGGLAAFDLAWRYPDVFGVVGVFSGSLWWRGEDGDWSVHQRSRLMHAQVRAVEKRPPLRCWFQAGTADETEDRDGNGVIDAIQDTTELIDELVALGFRCGEDVVYREVAGGEHNERTWSQVLPEFLRFALRRG